MADFRYCIGIYLKELKYSEVLGLTP